MNNSDRIPQQSNFGFFALSDDDQPLARQMQKPTLATRLGTNLDININEIYQLQHQDKLCDLILSVIKPSQPLLELDKAYRFQEYPHHQLVMKRSQAIDQKNQYNQESDQLSIKYNQDCEQLRQKYSQVHQSDLSQEEYRQQQTKLEQEYSQQEAKLSQERDQYLKYNSFQDYGYKLMKKYSAIKATVEQAIMEKYKGSRDIRAYKDNDIHPHLKTLIADEVRKAG